jgi:hypothetical protein
MKTKVFSGTRLDGAGEFQVLFFFNPKILKTMISGMGMRMKSVGNFI